MIKKVNALWLNGEYNPEAISLLDKYKAWNEQNR